MSCQKSYQTLNSVEKCRSYSDFKIFQNWGSGSRITKGSRDNSVISQPILMVNTFSESSWEVRQIAKIIFWISKIFCDDSSLMTHFSKRSRIQDFKTYIIRKLASSWIWKCDQFPLVDQKSPTLIFTVREF